jgi:hypothetical protein
MLIADRTILFPLLVLSAVVFGACGDTGEDGDDQATVATADEVSDADRRGSETGPSTDPSCPPETDVAAAVGHPVQSKPYGGGCYYETPDLAASVTIMRMSPGQADQVEQEMRDAAAPYSAQVVAIDTGDRGHAWGSPGYGQGYVVAGERAWMADVSIPSGDDGDKREAVIEILEMMIG